MKMIVSYLNFVFFIDVKAKSKYRILNFVFQFIKKKQNGTFGTRIQLLLNFNENSQRNLSKCFHS